MKKEKLVSLALAAALTLSACGGGAPAPAAPVEAPAAGQETGAAEAEQPAAEEAAAGEENAEEEQGLAPLASVSELPEGLTLYEEDGVLTFIGGDFYPGEVNDQSGAYDAIQYVLKLLGGGEETGLEPEMEIPTEESVYYTFHQTEGDVSVYGSTVKLITKNGKATGVVSSLTPGLGSGQIEEWAIEAGEAEEIVKKQFPGKNLRVVPDATFQTMLPVEEEWGPSDSNFFYAWAVFTNNIFPEYDMAYLVHYVDQAGNYLYYMPVAEPDSADAATGDYTAFVYDGMEPDVWSGTVKDHNGNSLELEVPVMVNTETGEMLLGDMERHVLVADYADFEFNDTLTVRSAMDGSFADNELIIYNTFLQVYDFYKDCGWTGPDGFDTPSLILMDWVDEDGEPVLNACYSGRQKGFQVFSFNREEPDGECMDIIAHEYTHCLTSTTMSNNLYENDYGAINEGMSDIMGNLIEAYCEATEDQTWLIQENGLMTLRSMSEPNLYGQPGFVWDQYYVPNASVPDGNNDNGGVHTNSSLLNRIAWLLHESGMDIADQQYFWMNVALAMTPRTNYGQMTELLPWCMEQAGFADHIPTLNGAIDQVGIGFSAPPQEAPEGLAMIQYQMPYAEELMQNYTMSTSFVGSDGGETATWPDAYTGVVCATLPPDTYLAVITFTNEDGDVLYFTYNDAGWMPITEEDLPAAMTDESFIIPAEAGANLTIETDSLAALLSE